MADKDQRKKFPFRYREKNGKFKMWIRKFSLKK